MVRIYPNQSNNTFSRETRKVEEAESPEFPQKKTDTNSLCQHLFDSMQFLFISHSLSRKRKIIQRKNSQIIFPSEKISSLKRRTTSLYGMPDYKFNPPSETPRTSSTEFSGPFSSSESKMEE